ncbi:MAG TPA: hypothetical protein VEF04_05635, partial [Blastocatellia bacterium]|nr:hypothetical protein [Blastocatellia bacterium]
SGRIPIYVCAECGELECGAVTVKIDKVADNFVWSDFSFENGYDCTTQTFHQVGPFAFNKTDYWQVLNRRQKHVDSRRQNAIG